MLIQRALTTCCVCFAIVPLVACFEDPATLDTNGDDDEETSTGDGDGDPTGDGDGDGDGDPTGDGDGDPTGDGDGDPSGDGDGDGDGACEDPCGPLELCHEAACVPAAQIVYLNFVAEGNFFYDPMLPSDATQDRQNISPDLVGEVLPGFNGDMFERQQILDLVRADFADLRVVITDQRPLGAAEYSMIVFTEHPSMDPNIVAMPADDCGDQNPNDIAFMFFNLVDLTHQQRANFVSSTAAQFAGVDPLVPEDANKADVMYPFLNETDPSFTDQCRPLPEGAGCEFNHSIHCDNASNMQNSWRELEAAWGF